MKKYSKFIIIILISLACELFLFNFSFFTTLFNKETVYVNKGKASIFIVEDINQDVSNIKVDFGEEIYTSLKVSVVDEGNTNEYLLNNKMISSKNKRSLYQYIHPAGKVKSMKLQTVNVLTHIEKVTINSKIPMMFSVVRFLIILTVAFMIYLFNTKSNFYDIKLFRDDSGKVIVFEVVMFLCLFLGLFCVSNDYFINTNFKNQHQYEELAKAIQKGRIYVEEVTDKTLLNMDNPYDTAERYKTATLEGASFLWDHSFYKGRYYVYFGIGPVLLTYLPYNFLTGKDLNNVFVDLMFLVLSSFSLTYLLYNICKKWFKDVKLATFLMCAILLISSSGVFYVTKRPDFYNVPIIVSLFFVTLGLSLFISATTTKKLFKTKLVVASCCMAFVALCRPQFLIASFLIIPLFYEYFVKEFNKKKIKEILCIAIPYIIFAVLTCAYNYIRFDNIFNFGAVYNLTTNDMTKRGFALARMPLGLFYYLLVPTKIVSVFPYIEPTEILPNKYFGRTIYESTYGGFFYTHFITVLTLFICKFKSYFKDKKLYWFCVLSFIFAIIVLIADTEMAGILPRYLMDFGYLLLIPTIVIVFALEKTLEKNRVLKSFVIILIFAAIIYEIFFLFVDSAPSIKDTMQNTFYYFYYLFNL